ncbi:MAG: dihydropteroate synthase [Flavobacteriales bacterium]
MDRPQVMGILNLTSDSFYSSSRFDSLKGIEDYLVRCRTLDVKFIDIGAQSTRPGFSLVDSKAQIEKLKPVLTFITKNFPEFYTSIDTSCPRVAEWALQHGGEIINDVEGGRNNPEIWNVCATYNAPYIVMHSRGEAQHLHEETTYHNVTVEVLQELSELMVKIRRAGVKDIIVDPGFGFSKTLEENHALMSNLRFFQLFEAPILCGISRKSMIYKKLNKTPETSINGTTALNTYALLNGATFLRVHDPEEATEIIRLLNPE